MTDFDASLLSEPTPVFPLPDCVLLPSGVLPLYVFEPRYRLMTQDILCRPVGQRLIATGSLRDAYEELYHTNHAPIHPVVCVGELIRHAMLPDGCYNIVLLGRARAKVKVEDGTGTYRKAMLTLIPTEPADMLKAVHSSVDDVRSLLCEMGVLGAIDPCLIEMISTKCRSAAEMVDLSSFHLIDSQDSALRQRILEEEKLEVRAEILAGQLRRMLARWRRRRAEGSEPDRWPPSPGVN